jgi:hypothetical protein
MKKIIMFMIILEGIACNSSFSQKKYGYAVINFRCGDNEPGKDRVYYSPVIELNSLNFPQYTDGIDPAIPKYSVRYYNYAISKWFEIYLREKYQILINSEDKYARKSTSVVYNDKNNGTCDDDKMNRDCFFLIREELLIIRNRKIIESSSPDKKALICEVIEL